ELSAVLLDHVRQEATRRGADAESITADDVTLERPRNRDHGDWASNVAMKLGKRLGTSPREFADALVASLAGVEGISGVDVAGPGFLNITLDAAAAGVLAQRILEAGAAYGNGSLYAGVPINLEFVSANPTGPI